MLQKHIPCHAYDDISYGNVINFFSNEKTDLSLFWVCEKI